MRVKHSVWTQRGNSGFLRLAVCLYRCWRADSAVLFHIHNALLLQSRIWGVCMGLGQDCKSHIPGVSRWAADVSAASPARNKPISEPCWTLPSHSPAPRAIPSRWTHTALLGAQIHTLIPFSLHSCSFQTVHSQQTAQGSSGPQSVTLLLLEASHEKSPPPRPGCAASPRLAQYTAPRSLDSLRAVWGCEHS